MKIQQPKNPEIRTKVDFLFERANILSKKPARKIGQKIKKKPTFEDKPWPKLVKNSHFLGQRWNHRSPYHLSTLGFSSTNGTHYFFCKGISKMSVTSSLLVQNSNNFESVWANLNRKIMSSNSIDGAQIANFINSLDRQQRLFCYWGTSPPLWSSNCHSHFQILIHCCF